METTEPKPKEKPHRAKPLSAAIQAPSPVAADRECQKCLSYLTRALDKAGSRPQSLLRALGVISYGSVDEEKKLYEQDEGGRGVLIRLESNKEVAATDGLVHRGDTSLLQKPRKDVSRNNPDEIILRRPDVILDQRSGENIPSSARTESEEQHARVPDNKSVTLGRRFTNAATLLADGIRHSAEDLLNDGVMPNGDVLTTSPTLESSQPAQVDAINKHLTTIAIECMSCGSDTRAEAGARAFVKGPEPLSIVLCSNRLSSQREVDEVLVHELVHIYDVHSRQMDLRDCRQLAYSEVRAAREAECSNSLTSFTANICAKDKATVATRNMFPDQGRKCVCAVFDTAMNDLAPFGDVKNNNNSAFSKAGCSKANATAHKTADHLPESSPPFSSTRRSDR